ncbi:MAG: HlyD family type I secretion periplasmic adaptor subunit [Rhodocyclaceae bacterium]|nr:HlyD family type I secretion periplasmic adaptor subunit [Rhodocyclaceae bacterium]MBX3670299.1 HlyD family type I secretion periplasmic adaptor subunit [Rhodocyclaceae bacterium]
MGAIIELCARYLRVFGAAWAERGKLAPRRHDGLERQFLPAILEIVETPASPLGRAVMWSIVAALATALLWSYLGEVDEVAVAPGKIIVADKPKLVQPAETAVVRRILVREGDAVTAGQTLIELDAAATATAAETERLRGALSAARLEATRYAALQEAALNPAAVVQLQAAAGASEREIAAELQAARSQHQEHRARLQSLRAEQARREAELAAAREVAAKLERTAPIARRRAEDYKSLAERHFVSEHAYLEREQVRIEQEQELAYQTAHVRELEAAVSEARSRESTYTAEYRRGNDGARLDAEKRAAQLAQELLKAGTREAQQRLAAPVAGIVQQLAVHSVGGVVTPAQALMLIVPHDYQPEVEAVLPNKDVGFVKVGQAAVVKVETFPYTHYGTLAGTVSFVSADAISDEKRGLVFQAYIRLTRATLEVNGRPVRLTPGMQVSAEINTGRRRVIDFFLDPMRKTVAESLHER